jgi:hypothetical protein
MSSLGEQYPQEQARVRELLGIYKSIGPGGAFGAAGLEAVLREADAAAISGDLVRMIRAFKAMQECRE